MLTDTSGNTDVLTDISLNGYILNTLDTWSTFKEFIKKFNIHKSLDFLGCALLQSNNWKYILTELETEQHLDLNIRASDDETGNLKVGSDWVLESDNVNIKDLYFDSETIEKWKYMLVHDDVTVYNNIYSEVAAKVTKAERQSTLHAEAHAVANAEADIAYAATGDSDVAGDVYNFHYSFFVNHSSLIALVNQGSVPVSQTNIKFSDLKTLYNNVNSPASITNPFSLGEFKGCEFVQPISNITADSNYEETFTSSGTFTVPAGVTEFSAVCVGGGGGGSGCEGNSSESGSGGGGGGLAYGTISTTPGYVYSITVGSGGAGGGGGANSGICWRKFTNIS